MGDDKFEQVASLLGNLQKIEMVDNIFVTRLVAEAKGNLVRPLRQVLAMSNEL